MRNFAKNLFSDIIKTILMDKENIQELAMVQEAIKVEITEDKEKELIKKFGRRPMEKLAKEMNFRGKVLNKIK